MFEGPHWQERLDRAWVRECNLRDQIERLQEITARYRKALSWYADELSWVPTQLPEPRSAANADRGTRARRALAPPTLDA